ncbi:phospholipase, patatin family [Treponema vincentii ATCC 35580]|uniref:Phospholipase, patatin family n=1 Tax=Treponema vincentii ATCC 35580 TaxID=596324 RepID=C8PMJ7_9SPIR|nr:patatin-like phospholipase family protein [Treponema vincentii]EEV21414.1 phospholipase, patatin family [Treponema vincentii ATCC 35580]
MMNGLNIYQIKKLFRKIVLAAVLICSLTSLLSAQNVGLVLSGGGAKGAYEVGVWKALTDVGITDRISVISGTSVGALNAGLFVCTPVKEAEKLWRNEVGIDTFLMPDTDTVEALLEVVIKDILSGAARANLRYANEEDNSELLKKVKKTASVVGNSTSNLVKSLGKELLEYSQADKHNEGLFKRDSLEEILDRYITLEKNQSFTLQSLCNNNQKKNVKKESSCKRIFGL